MTRQLRPRKSRPSYVSLAGLDEERLDAGPSTIALDDADSGSDFTPEREAKKSGKRGAKDQEKEEGDDDSDFSDQDGSDEDPVVQVISSKKLPTTRSNGVSKETGSGKNKAVTSIVKSTTSRNTTFSGSMRRQMYMLPAPSVHHRHRAVPLYSLPGPVERLDAPPVLFDTPKVTWTNSFTHDAKVTDRMNKAWGFNVGSGPLWELVEDRAWFKEAQGEPNSESRRRPRVHENVPVKAGWELLDAEQAAVYLPTDDVATDEGNLKPPPPVPCSFGPFGSQSRLELEMFETLNMAHLIPESNAYVFNAGAPVWGIDWCPIHPNDRQERSNTQYLALAPFPSHSHSPEIGDRVSRPSYACIQIWSFGPGASPRKGKGREKDKDKEGREGNSGQVKCEMILCIDSGPAHALRWCPLPSHDAFSNTQPQPRKLGLLAGTFEDGSFSIFAVPDPTAIVPPHHDGSSPVFLKIPAPILRIELEETACWSFDWANSDVVAIGTTNGTIAVYDIGTALKQINDPELSTHTSLLPTHYITVHQSAIRALAWIRAPSNWPDGTIRLDDDPTVIASGGYDGMECMTDIREGRGVVVNRTRDIISALAYSPFGGGPITIDHENIVKAYSASPRMLGRGHMLMEPQGPIWSVAASDYHPQLAVGSADGTCSTTNMLRSTRRGGSVPFFVYKIYQMDYNRNTKEYRMLERFLPQETQDRANPTKTNDKTNTNTPALGDGTGAWPREVSVHQVMWNSGGGLGAAGMLASGTASGLCRIDVLWGRLIKDKIVYGGVEGIRMESGFGEEDEMDVDGEGDEDEV